MTDRDPDAMEHITGDTIVRPMRDTRFNLTHWHRVQDARVRCQLDPDKSTWDRMRHIQHDNNLHDARTT